MAFDDRTRILLGDQGADALARSRVCVFGLGGVGAAAAMDLVRVGVGAIVVIDFDEVSESNLNRLYFGYIDEVDAPKTDSFAKYAHKINPAVRIEARSAIVHGSSAASMIPPGCDYYLDCIDTLAPKVNLLAALAEAGLPFISSMGTAGRLAPERLRVGSLWETHDCPLASTVRKRLRRLGFGPPDNFPCVWSDEPPVAPVPPADGTSPGTVVAGVRVRAVQGSAPFVPQAAGHLLASVAVRRMLFT
ncbi:MAG: ThiF family adenylyltransferase [Spirochaetales bacterium]|nr:ThiF family adenylyltransferase [Spirochaetales bacterium]